MGINLVLTFIVLFLLFGMGFPVTCVLAIAGAFGLVTAFGWSSLGSIGSICWSGVGNWVLTSLPLFILTGEILLHAKIGRDLFDFTSLCFRRIPLVFALASVMSCAIFAAISGSSPATAATIGLFAIPEMEKRKYDPKLIYGTLAAGGTLGILIPPSIIMILYGVVAEQSVGKLFLAGFIPGFMLTAIFMIYILIRYRKAPFARYTIPEMTREQKLGIYVRVLPALAIIILVLGTIYLGIVTPTEAAGLGAALSAILAFGMRRLSKHAIVEILFGTIQTTCMILFIVVSALIFSYYLTLTRIPQMALGAVQNLSTSPYVILTAIYILLLILGCLIDGASIVYITTPIIFPIIMNCGFDPVWYGIFLTISIEVGLITPPVGLNLYVIHGIAKTKSMEQVIRGAAPFIILMTIGLLILTLFPSIALWLPSTMK